MTTEQAKTLEALQTAIRMEIDGRECYLGAARQIRGEAGQKLLRELADAEDEHRRQFEKIYEAMRRRKAWPKIKLAPGRAAALQETLLEACRLTGTGAAGQAAELEAIRTAVDKEKESQDFYRRRSEAATYPAEKEFYAALAAEEREHELVLVDYEEFLTDPVGWYTRTERQSVDGG